MITAAADHKLHATLAIRICMKFVMTNNKRYCLLRQMNSEREPGAQDILCNANRCGGSQSACHAGIKYMHEVRDEEQEEMLSAAADEL